MVLKNRFIPLLGLLCLLIVLFCACGASWVKVTPTMSQKNGISPETSFVIDIENLTVDTPNPEKLIELSPENNFILTQNDGGGLLLTPSNPFMAGEKVALTITNPIDGKQKSFSYSVENQLAVRSNFPANDAKRVPVDCGVEVQLNTSTVTIENFKDAFSISPDIQGQVTSDGNRFVFYPTQKFAYGTKYTVTVDNKILAAKGGAKLSEPLSFSFNTISQDELDIKNMFQSDGNNLTINMLTSDVPLIAFYIDNSIPADKQLISVDVFKFNNWQDYKAELDVLTSQKSYFSYLDVDTSKLQKQSHFETLAIEATKSNNYYSFKRLVQFPEALPEGWYVAEFSLNCNGAIAKQQLLIQSSDISMFYMMSDKELLVWANDAENGTAIENAAISVTGGYSASGTTDAAGTALLKITDNSPDNTTLNINNGIITITAGDKIFVDKGYFYKDETDQLQQKYITYLYTDREIYKPTDTVKVWGVIKPRFDNIKLPNDLTLSLADGSVSVPISPAPDGTFTASLSYKDIAANYSQTLALKSGEVNLYMKSIRIEDYSKPVYLAETSSNKPVYLLNVDNKPQITLNVSTYDGTPAAGFKSDFISFGNIYTSKQEFTADASGKITTGISITDDQDTWIPQNYSFYFENADPQGENLYSYGSIYAIHRNVALDAEAKSVGGKTTVDVTTNKIALDKIKTSDDLFPLSNIKGEAIRREGAAYLHKVYYEKKSDGTYYDYITRTHKDLYQYTQRDELIETRPFVTENGKCSITNLPQSDNEACYYLELSTKDTGGRTVIQKVYLGFLEPYYSRWEDGTHSYDFTKISTNTQSNLDDLKNMNSMYLYPHSMSSFKQDENVSLLLQDKGQPVEKFSGRMLYTVVQDKISNINVIDKAGFTLPFNQSLVPNYIVTGAYFDGRHIYSITDTYMNYDPEAQALNIALVPDKQSYKPADTATVTATVTVASNGKPAANAAVLLSVVDEAVFALEPQNPEFLANIYRAVYHPIINKHTSFVQTPFGDSGGMGGGGDGNATMRKYFPDSAQFITARTDSNGKASFKFTLPDNITSWRTTALALTQNNFAGDAKVNLSATKAYFVNPILSEVMLSGDTFAIGLRSSGNAIDEDSISQYTAVVESSNGFKKTLSSSAPALEYTTLTLDGLTTGDYTVTITAKCNKLTDVMRLPFKVTDSAIQVSQMKNFNLNEQPKLNAVSYPVSLSVYNKTYELQSQIINNIVSSDYGNRIDAILAKRYIAKMYEQQGVEWYGAEIDNHTPLIYDLLPVVPQGGRNTELTANALLAVKSLMNPINESYLNFASYDGGFEGRKSALYLCEATQNPKIATEISRKLNTDTTLDYTDKLILSTALAVCGETKQAQAQYDKLVLPNTATLTGISGEKAMYINIKDTSGQYHSNTAAASVFASVLQTDEADDFVRYLIEKKSATDPFIMEQLVYLTHCVDKQPSKASFSYVLDGKTITKQLKGSEICCLSFSKQQLEKANLKTISGNVYANAYYYGTPPSTNTAKLIGLTKSIQPIEGSFETGKLVKVTLTPDISKLDTDIGNFYMTLDDYIPTGMRFEKMADDNHGYGWYMSSRQKQRVRFEVYGAAAEGGISPIEYYARLTTPGTYVVESGYITSSVGDTWGSSPRSEITIKPIRISHHNK